MGGLATMSGGVGRTFTTNWASAILVRKKAKMNKAAKLESNFFMILVLIFQIGQKPGRVVYIGVDFNRIFLFFKKNCILHPLQIVIPPQEDHL